MSNQNVAKNGASLDTISSIMNQFHLNCGTSGNMPKTPETKQSLLNTSLSNDVTEFSLKLNRAMTEHLQGSSNAIETFKDALKMRSMLLSDPAVTRQDDGALKQYLKNIVHISDDGNPSKSLELTKDLHANALDASYKGVTPSKEVAPEMPQPLL